MSPFRKIALLISLCFAFLLVSFHIATRQQYNVPHSTVYCDFAGPNVSRSTVCEYSNLLYTPADGFLYNSASPTELSATTMTGSFPWMDEWHKPKVTPLRHHSQRIIYHDETVYAFTALAGGHMTHFIINTLMPLAEVLTRWPRQAPLLVISEDYRLDDRRAANVMLAVQNNYWGQSEALWAQKDAELADHLEFFVTRPLGVRYFGRVYANASLHDHTLHLFPRVVFGLGATCGWPNVCDRVPDARAVQRMQHLIHREYTPQCSPQRHPMFVLVITRKGHRSMKNFGPLEDALRADSLRLGFQYQISTLDGMDHLQRAQLFCRTAVVIAVHGNALGNIVFMAPNTSVLEILPYHLDATFPFTPFEWPSRLLALDYASVVCEDFSCGVPEQLTPGWYALARDVVLTDAFVTRVRGHLHRMILRQQNA
eukprot:TRINITY_DN7674_c0_g1_i1.p1 TRINITY_DN7674_c0_g1~~TRINITY_DN7674_c0_g1_i1.p1  ORF type:complete len:426 (-),score=51.24 TRINITY_DN7674_c0_g1_i1:1322-2599(-)